MADIPLVINGRPLGTDCLALSYQGVYYAPLREIFRVIGGHTTWQGRENQAVIKWINHLIVVPSASSVITLNGERKLLAHPTRLMEGRLCVPLESFAEVFSGSLSKGDNDTLMMFLPVGYLSGLRIEGDALNLAWTANGNAEFDLRGPQLNMRLSETTWPSHLRRIEIERLPEGSLGIVLETWGGQITHAVGEQGIRVEWKKPGGKLSGLTFAIDAGHGGADPGAIGPAGNMEKDIVRSIADMVIAQLVAAGALVVDARPYDDRATLAERIRRIRQGGAQVLVSIHLNAHERLDANGIETFHLEGNPGGAFLATAVQDELVRALQLRNRGVKQAAFSLLKEFDNIPAVLTEVGFVTNLLEEKILADLGRQQVAAQAIYSALIRFVTDHRSLFVV